MSKNIELNAKSLKCEKFKDLRNQLLNKMCVKVKRFDNIPTRTQVQKLLGLNFKEEALIDPLGKMLTKMYNLREKLEGGKNAK